MKHLSDAEIESMKHGRPKDSADRIPDLILARWSPRAFADRPVSDEDLRAVLTAAGWAASSYNEQPWRFLVGRRGDGTYEKILATLTAHNRAWAQKAPVLLLAMARRTFTHTGEPNRFALHDTGAAIANLSLCATALGLHTHAMQGYDADAARQAFAVPEEFEMGATVALGYFGDPASLSGELLERETAPRSRKALDQLVFAGRFGESAAL